MLGFDRFGGGLSAGRMPESTRTLLERSCKGLSAEEKRALGALMRPHEPALSTRYVKERPTDQTAVAVISQMPLAVALTRFGSADLLFGAASRDDFFEDGPRDNNDHRGSGVEYAHVPLPTACAMEACAMARPDILAGLARLTEERMASEGPDGYGRGRFGIGAGVAEWLGMGIGGFERAGFSADGGFGGLEMSKALRSLAAGSSGKDAARVRECALLVLSIMKGGLNVSRMASEAGERDFNDWVANGLLSVGSEFGANELFEMGLEMGAVPRVKNVEQLLRAGANGQARRAAGLARKALAGKGWTKSVEGGGSNDDEGVAVVRRLERSWQYGLDALAKGSMEKNSNEWTWVMFNRGAAQCLELGAAALDGEFDFPSDDKGELSKGKEGIASFLRAVGDWLPGGAEAAREILEKRGLWDVPASASEALFYAKVGSEDFFGAWSSFSKAADGEGLALAAASLLDLEGERIAREGVMNGARAGVERGWTKDASVSRLYHAADCSKAGWAGFLGMLTTAKKSSSQWRAWPEFVGHEAEARFETWILERAAKDAGSAAPGKRAPKV